MSPVGHVHGFIEEIGQGVQHVASRVENLVEFVQSANDNRKRVGEGFTFLNIPRSYYGVLTHNLIEKGIAGKLDEFQISSSCAQAIVDICERVAITDGVGAVDLNLSNEEIAQRIDSVIDSTHKDEFLKHKDEIIERILLSRYLNLYKLLLEQLDESTYIGIVKNKILVDVQGDDLLFQIFTSNILQRESSDEAPFFEFIQRVCSQ